MVSIEQLEKDIAEQKKKLSGLRKGDSLAAKKKALQKELFLLKNPKIARIGRGFKKGFKKGVKFIMKKRQELRDKEFGVKKIGKKKKLSKSVLKELRKLQSKGKKGQAFKTAKAIFEKSRKKVNLAKPKLRPSKPVEEGFFSGLTF